MKSRDIERSLIGRTVRFLFLGMSGFQHIDGTLTGVTKTTYVVFKQDAGPYLIPKCAVMVVPVDASIEEILGVKPGPTKKTGQAP